MKSPIPTLRHVEPLKRLLDGATPATCKNAVAQSTLSKLIFPPVTRILVKAGRPQIGVVWLELVWAGLDKHGRISPAILGRFLDVAAISQGVAFVVRFGA